VPARIEMPAGEGSRKLVEETRKIVQR